MSASLGFREINTILLLQVLNSNELADTIHEMSDRTFLAYTQRTIAGLY